MASEDVAVKFGADLGQLQQDISEIPKRIGESFAGLGESVSGITEMFKHLQDAFVALGAVLAGGEVFREAINSANELNSAAERMSRTLGITSSEAGVINTAIQDVASKMGIGGVSAETYTDAFIHFNRQLRMNSDAMRAMGVDVDALARGTKTSNEVFREAVQLVGQYAPGVDQTQAAMRLFGRNINDVQVLLGLTDERLEEARKKQEALNLTITQEGVEAATKYRVAMNDVHDVLEGVGKTIGEAVMPHFTALSEQLAEFGPQIVEATGAAIQTMITLWDELASTIKDNWAVVREVFEDLFGEVMKVFGGDGLTAMDLFKNAVRVVQIAIVLFSTVSREVMRSFGTSLEWLISWLRTFSSVAIAAFHFDWTGINQAWRDGVNESAKILADGTQRMIDIAAQGRAKMDAIANGSLDIKRGTPAGSSAGAGTKTMPIGKDTSGMDARLAAQLALQRAMQDASLKLQLEFLKQAGDKYDQSYKHGLMSTRDYYASKLAVEQAANTAHLGALQTELAQASEAEAKAAAKSREAIKPQDRTKAEAEVLKFKTEQVKIQGQINVLLAQQSDLTRKNAQEEADALIKAQDALDQITTKRVKQRADFEVSTQRAALDQLKALRLISAQASFDVERQLEDKTYKAQVADIAARRALIRGSADEQRQQQEQLNAEAEAAEEQHQARVTQITNAGVQDRMKFQLDAQQRIEDAMGTAITDFMNGTKSLSGVLKSFFNSVIQEINNMVAKSLVKNLFGAGTSGGGIIGSLLGGITGNGGGLSSLFSAAGGWAQVPADGVLTELHRDEMVLPADLAAGVRAMSRMSLPGSIGSMGGMTSIPGNAPQLALGSGGQGPTGPITIHQNFPPATDPRTAMQVAAAAARGLSAATRRNG